MAAVNHVTRFSCMHGRKWLRVLGAILAAMTFVVAAPSVTGGDVASASASRCAAVGPLFNPDHPDAYQQIDPGGYSRSDFGFGPSYHTDLYACQHGALIAYIQTFWPEGIQLKPTQAVQHWSLEIWVCGFRANPFNAAPAKLGNGGWTAYYAPIDYTWHGHNGKICGQQAADTGSEFNFPGAANQPAKRGDPSKALPDQLYTHV